MANTPGNTTQHSSPKPIAHRIRIPFKNKYIMKNGNDNTSEALLLQAALISDQKILNEPHIAPAIVAISNAMNHISLSNNSIPTKYRSDPTQLISRQIK